MTKDKVTKENIKFQNHIFCSSTYEFIRKDRVDFDRLSYKSQMKNKILK